MRSIWYPYEFVIRWFSTLDRQEILVVLIVAMCFGLLCMRGYGSRQNY